MHGVDAQTLTESATIESLLLKSAHAAGANVLFCHFHTFGPGQGVTGVVLLAESHISIHTWPEFGFVAADIFMCGKAEPELALEVIRLALEPASCKVQTISRGLSERWQAALEAQ